MMQTISQIIQQKILRVPEPFLGNKIADIVLNEFFFNKIN
jgi:hypothetical protein